MADDKDVKIYRAALYVQSVDDGADVRVVTMYDPPISDFDAEEVGYIPAAFTFMNDIVVPASMAAAYERVDEIETVTPDEISGTVH